MATPNMNLTLPTVSVTIGPAWATQLNAAITLVDSHDHSSGKGVQITPSGLNINADLDVQENNVDDARSYRMASQSSTLGTASDVRSIYSYNGNLYYNNSSGTAVQITNGGTVNTAAASQASAFSHTSVNSNLTIASGDSFSFLNVNTGSSWTITLPLAGDVNAGRFYVIKDATGTSETNAITLTRAGSDTIDGASSQSLSMDQGMWIVVSDGSSKWMLMRPAPDFLTKSTLTLGTYTFNSSTGLTVGTSIVNSSGFTTGATPSLSGAVRLGNNASVAARSAGDTADYNLIKVDSGDIIQVGDGTATYVNVPSTLNVEADLSVGDDLSVTGDITYASPVTVTKCVPMTEVRGRTSSAINDGGDIDASYLPLTNSHATFDRGDMIIAAGNAGSDAAYQFYLPISAYLAHGAALTSAVLTLDPNDGHAGLPQCMPKFAIARAAALASSAPVSLISTGGGFATDAAADAAAFDALHTITFTPNQNNTIDLEQYTYYACIQDEGGTNSDIAGRYLSLKLTYTLSNVKGGL